MKKILALILSLMLLLPAAAMAEAASNPDVYTVEFDDFSITINAADILQKGTKAEGQVLFMLFPQYDENSLFHNNINGLWTAEDMSIVSSVGAEEFAKLVLEQSAGQFTAQNIAVSNQQVLAAEYDEESKSTTIITSMDADYTAAGYDLKMNLCQLQLYFPMPTAGAGSYIFTFSADSLASLEALMAYMDAIDFYD